MGWRFVGRSEHVEQIRTRLDSATPHPLVLVGEPGIGRTSLVEQALTHLDDRRDALLRTGRGDDGPFSSLRHLLPDGFVERPVARHTVREATELLVERSAGRRPVVMADDAHRCDPASMLVLQRLHREAGAFLLLTHPDATGTVPVPDPVDCLRYEHGIQTLHLPPLSQDEVGVVLAGVLGGRVKQATTDALHAATGGNPGLLHDLVVRQDLGSRMVCQDGIWRLGDSEGSAETQLTCRGTEHLHSAVMQAWSELSVGRVEDLCRIAMWSGLADRVAVVRATVLLLRGRSDEALQVLDSARVRDADDHARQVLLRAMCLALGLRRTSEASELLAVEAARNHQARDRLLAQRAWILALDGATKEALDALSATDHRRDREAALFAHATWALVALSANRGAQAVSYLRRALAVAEGRQRDLPWMGPYLRAYLIDSLLLTGRITEATSLAGDFHAAAPTCGWNVAVALSTLTTGTQVGEPVVTEFS